MTSENHSAHHQFQINTFDNSTASSRQPSIADDLSNIPQEDIDKFLPQNFPMTIRTNNDDDNSEIKIPLRRQIFNDKKILKQVLTKPKKGVYMCNHCDEIFYTFAELLDHFDEFDIKRPHKCSHPDCPWNIVGFNRVRQLNRHESSVHSTDKDFKCHIQSCNKKFGRVDLLNRHLKSVHENKNSRFNRKLSKDNSINTGAQSTSGNSPTGSMSSIDEYYQLHDHSTTSPIIPSTQPASLRNSSSSLDQRDSKYKYTIEFLTNSEKKNE